MSQLLNHLEKSLRCLDNNLSNGAQCTRQGNTIQTHMCTYITYTYIYTCVLLCTLVAITLIC